MTPYSKSSETKTEIVEKSPIYSFVLTDKELAEKINEKLYKVQIKEKTFYYRYIETKTKHLFQIYGKLTDDPALKKVLFEVGLKSTKGVTKR